MTRGLFKGLRLLIALLATQGAIAGAEVVGAIEGAFSVTPMGAATYVIPIEVPVGIEGVAPKLALVYSSAGGEDVAGYGWGLSGLSVIARCALLRLDGRLSDSKDGYCLDGQRLILDPTSQHYKTERDSFSKITKQAESAGDVFTVYHKDGGVSRYTYYSAAGHWKIVRHGDRAGNHIAFTYSNDPNSGQSMLYHISYTRNDAAGKTGDAQVSIVYENHNIFDANGQSPAQTVRRISGISVSGKSFEEMGIAGLNDPVENHKRFYKLTYVYHDIFEQGNGRNSLRLGSVALCREALGECSTATSFTWDKFVVGDTRQPYITKISNPLLPEISITYKPLDDSSVYVVEQGNTQRVGAISIGGILVPYVKTVPADGHFYQIRKPTMQVVSRVSRADGIGGQNHTDYRYTNLRTHRHVHGHATIRKGSAGSTFEKVEALDHTAQVRTESSYEYLLPYTGFTKLQKDFLCLGGALDFTAACHMTRKLENQFDIKGSGLSRFPYIRTSTTTQYELPAGI
jgi:hypothetical protein